jgi:predicted metal-dependent hydrolase
MKQMKKKFEVKYGAHRIVFSLAFSERKRVRISVKPDQSVTVTAPLHADHEKVMEKVKKRAAWILKQINYFSSFDPMETAGKYLSGETHRYLGRQYRLKIFADEKNKVKLKGRYILICSRDRNNGDYNKKLLYGWYKEHAEKKFEELAGSLYRKLKKYDVAWPSIQLKRMKSRWGSCHPAKNKIILNTDLIKAPSHCVEYVIAHELCHLKYPYHGKEFYNLLSFVMPDWQVRKKRLENVFILR